MSRPKKPNGSGTVQWRGNPSRPFARISMRDQDGVSRRPWKDLELPDLCEDTPENRAVAERKAAKIAKRLGNAARKSRFVGKEAAKLPEDRTHVSDLEERFMKALDGREMKGSTRANHKSHWHANIKPMLGHHLVATLAAHYGIPRLRDWVREMAAKFAPSTVRNNTDTLTLFFYFVKAEQWVNIPSNPMRNEDVRDLLPPTYSPEPEEIQFLTRPQAEALLARPALPHTRFGIYLLAMTSGLRDGELRGLQWKYVDLDGKIPNAWIRHQAGWIRDDADRVNASGTRIDFFPLKTKYSKRRLPLHPLAVEWLRWWKREGWQAYVGREPTEEDVVFSSPAGEKWRPYSAEVMRNDLKAAGQSQDFVTHEGARAPFEFHGIRHSFATWLEGKQVDGEVIDRLLGQSPRSVRKRHYQGVSDELLEVMAEAVGKLVLSLPERPGVGPQSAPEPSAAPAGLGGDVVPQVVLHGSARNATTGDDAANGATKKVNKTDSAVQLTHRPTGLMVRVETERSQHQNRATALALLRARLWQAQRDREATARADDRRAQVGSGMRGDKRRTVAVQRDSVVDHVTGRSWSVRDYLRGDW